MSRTSVSSLAKTLGISKVRVYQVIKDLPNEQKPKQDERNRYILDEEAVNNIKKYFAKTTNKVNKDEQSNLDNTELVKSLKGQIENLINQLKIKDEQLKAKDEQINNLTKLADQSQQLQLIASDKIKKLESVSKKVDTKVTSEKSSDEPKESKKESIFSKIFH